MKQTRRVVSKGGISPVKGAVNQASAQSDMPGKISNAVAVRPKNVGRSKVKGAVSG